VLSLDFRHTCGQHEGMVGYGWDDYDVRKGGRQTIHDEGNNIDIQTEFIKVEGGQHGITDFGAPKYSGGGR
jgi:mannosyl-oligosaccharide glucosidase